MAGFSFPIILAFAVEVVDQILALASVLARVYTAIIDIKLTKNTFPSLTADTLVEVDTVNASPTVFTRITLTIINIFVTVRASETLAALAGEPPSGLTPALAVGPAHVGGDVADAVGRAVGGHGHGAAVDDFTGSGPTVVFQMGTILPFVVFWAAAEVVAGQIEALRPIPARVRLAVINIQLTQAPRETSRAETLESTDFILTVTAIETGGAFTFIDVLLTVGAGKARHTGAAVSIDQILANSAILALLVTVIDV